MASRVTTRYTEPIKEDKRHMISYFGSLVILDTTLEDGGEYRAVVSNGAGSVTVAAFLEFFFPTPCRQYCQNGGTCYQAHYCYCQSGFFGRYCESGEDYLPPVSPPNSGSGSGGYSGYYDDNESGDDQYSDTESGDSEYGSGYSEGESVNSEGDSVISSGSGEPPILSPSYGDDNETNFNTENGETDRKRRQSNDVAAAEKSFPWILAGERRQLTQKPERRWHNGHQQLTVNGQLEMNEAAESPEKVKTRLGKELKMKATYDENGFGERRDFDEPTEGLNRKAKNGRKMKRLRIEAELTDKGNRRVHCRGRRQGIGRCSFS
ncbi:hypothetical protein GBAR_LOCUS1864 [Geodia barretti]|uniref:EGF-like domain-containing protein n=1 Tax=Geodia barretti TaxID=519541 RepID=A0AA35QXR0_GEOBA|nr:hypothetical protein GBAR_LOCUS1864 [Geodia barretti]